MPYDLKVLVLNQKKTSELPFLSSINIVNEIDDFDGKRYHSIIPFMTQTNGVWYSLIKEDEDGVVYASFCTSDFDIDQTSIEIPYWIKHKSCKNDLTPLIIKQEFKNEFEAIVRISSRNYNAISEVSKRRSRVSLWSYFHKRVLGVISGKKDLI